MGISVTDSKLVELARLISEWPRHESGPFGDQSRELDQLRISHGDAHLRVSVRELLGEVRALDQVRRAGHRPGLPGLRIDEDEGARLELRGSRRRIIRVARFRERGGWRRLLRRRLRLLRLQPELIL